MRRSVYTAFGELVWTADGSTETRYGYAGAHGYEEGLMPESGSPWRFPFLHVGARWYDAGAGRFLQFDPIGIRGGLNVYTYVLNVPSALVDPSGLLYCPACEANFYRKNPPPPKKKKKEPSDASGAEAFLSCTAWMDTKAAKVATRYARSANKGAVVGGIVGGTAGGIYGGVYGGPPGAVYGAVGGTAVAGMMGWVGGLLKEGLSDLGWWDAIGW